MAEPTAQGTTTFKAPDGGQYETWYCTFGDVKSGITPLVVVHGGPGACHEYMLPLKALSTKHSIPLVFYDQIGNGRSTHLKDKAGDESFWSMPLFTAELNNLVDHLDLRDGGYDVLGHSWGAMFGSEYGASQPRGLRRLVLASGPASMEVWMKGVNALRAQLPKDVQEVLDRGEEKGDFESPEYEAATLIFYKRHLCRIEPWPAKEVDQALGHMMGDTTVYGTMYGVSELVVTGNLKNWSAVDKLHKIDAPTLLINGQHDEAQDVSMMPFFQKIKQVKWVTLEGTSHFAHVERPDRYVGVVAGFLAN